MVPSVRTTKPPEDVGVSLTKPPRGFGGTLVSVTRHLTSEGRVWRDRGQAVRHFLSRSSTTWSNKGWQVAKTRARPRAHPTGHSASPKPREQDGEAGRGERSSERGLRNSRVGVWTAGVFGKLTPWGRTSPLPKALGTGKALSVKCKAASFIHERKRREGFRHPGGQRAYSRPNISTRGWAPRGGATSELEMQTDVRDVKIQDGQRVCLGQRPGERAQAGENLRPLRLSG